MSESPRRRRPKVVAEKRYGSTATKRPTKSAAKRPSRAKTKTKSRFWSRKSKPAKRSSGGKGGGRGPLGLLKSAFRFVFGLIWGLTWRLGMVVGLIIGLAVFYVYATLPEYTELLDGRASGSVTMLDRYGETFAWRGDQFGGVVTVETISPHLRNAIVATEDKRFYWHFGVSPRGVASAVRINMREGRGPLEGHGGSTITQQTAKLLCLGTPYDPAAWKNEAEYEADCRRTTMLRKIKEAIYAMAMEVKFSKNDILAIYMNRAYLGEGTRGFEAASQRYFGKSAASVSAAEAAMLAGLLKAPTRYAPTNDLERARDRAAVIIGLMEDQKYLSAAEALNARGNPAALSSAASESAGGYFADWMTSVAPKILTSGTVDVTIRTTLDRRLQKAAEDALDYVFENKVREGSEAQAAIVVMSADGAVRAMVGGRKKQFAGAFNRATQARRQTGSSFKPFVYATALELGYSPNDTVMDEPFCMNIAGSGQWCPKNYTNKHYGRITMTRALRDSLNVPAVKISEQAGRENVRSVATDFGIESDLADGPALALGASESTLIEMTGAYAGILNGGSSVEPYGFTEATFLGDNAPIRNSVGGIGERVIRREAAEQLIWMMEKVVSEGTGARAKLEGRPAAGKTGTTQGARDAWFVGFTADYVTGVWMGYDDNRPLTGVTGGGLPADIWRETMVRVHEGLEVKPLPMRPPIKGPATVDPPKQVAKPKAKKKNKGGLGKALDKVLKDILGG